LDKLAEQRDHHFWETTNEAILIHNYENIIQDEEVYWRSKILGLKKQTGTLLSFTELLPVIEGNFITLLLRVIPSSLMNILKLNLSILLYLHFFLTKLASLFIGLESPLS